MEVEGIESANDVPDAKTRLLIELEFVQNLANPTYLHYLAANKFFEDEAFMRFLRYLQYWKRPEYIVYLKFPHCLAFLDALVDEDEEFRKHLTLGGSVFRDFIHKQQGLHWMHEARTIGLDASSVGDSGGDAGKQREDAVSEGKGP